ncbi:MAG: coat protein [Sanya totivirus 6]|nr:MAG: coat protein [Sanya totivirus 6]
MDHFINNYFKDFMAPGVPFTYSDSMDTFTYVNQGLIVWDGDGAQRRYFRSYQPMTPLGIVECTIQGESSDYDGISREFVTAEGHMHVEAIFTTLRNLGASTSTLLANHMERALAFSWRDNHVPLLVNMLRYVLIRCVEEQRQSGHLRFGRYSDGHVSIDMDQFWPAHYPQADAPFGDWPGDLLTENYPDIEELSSTFPISDTPAIDLRNMDKTDMQFVLLMLGKWQRTTRYRLDFSTPRLCNRVLYRGNHRREKILEFLHSNDPRLVSYDDLSPPPPPYTAAQAWRALRGYVSNNRLFDQFSAALMVIVSTMYQFKPVTAESVYWLKPRLEVTLPIFDSVRGRYPFLNVGEAAFISQRGLREWSFIGGSLAKINLMALCFIQAAQTGIALRALRDGLGKGGNYDQVAPTEGNAGHYGLSPYVAEATRMPAPLYVIPGVSVRYSEVLDVSRDDRFVRATAYDAAPGSGYDMVEVRLNAGAQPDWSSAKPLTHADYGETEPERPACFGDSVRFETPQPPDTRPVMQALRVRVIPMAGCPTLLLPLAPFTEKTAFDGKGRVGPFPRSAYNKRGLKVSTHQAWQMAHIYRLAGYDLPLRCLQQSSRVSQAFSPNDVNFTWPVLHSCEDEVDDILAMPTRVRHRHFLELPDLTSRYNAGRALEYQFTYADRGVAPAPHDAGVHVFESSSRIAMPKAQTVVFHPHLIIERMRGFVQLSEQGFQFVRDAQAGVIPAPEAAPVAPIVHEVCLAGGQN